MNRENIEKALALSKRLEEIDAQIAQLVNVQSGTGMRIRLGYQHNHEELACTDLSREEALAMMASLRESIVVALHEVGVSDVA